MAVAVAVLAVFTGRLVQVQVVEASALAQDALDTRLATSTTLAHRGDITDADGVVLATSVERYTVVADQKTIAEFTPSAGHVVDGEPLTESGPVGLAKLLSPVLGVPAPELAADLAVQGDAPNRAKVLQRNVVPEVQREIANLGVRAYISTNLVAQRTYPAGNVAGNLVGFVNSEQEGMGGLESQYDELLSGTSGSELYERGRDGPRIPTGVRESVEARPGDDLQLSISWNIQWKAQDALDAAVAETGAEYGIVVVEEIATGRIITLADSGTIDPNDRSTSAVADPSRAVSNIFDPGSTSKVITMAAALEGGYATADSQFEVPYMYTTSNGQTFRDSHEHGLERLTLAGVLADSSNTGTVQIGERIPKQVRHDYLSAFGLGQMSGLDLPGESAGILHPADEWDGRTEYAVLFGQGLSVNAVQATHVFSTIANGGVRMPMRLVDGSTAADGTFTPIGAGDGTRVVSEETADTVLQMMEAVVEEGTGSSASIPGYRVAGKTGTAEAAGPDGRLSGIMASFIGVAPADDPQYTVSVFLKDPRTSIFGGVVAAPVFSEVMGFTLQHMEVPPSRVPYEPLATTW
ncbi:peptidoglycan D,D-transpeptidase FtsI family protein [Oerskovia flava]|uniref:peptidoglycan D,D-transpeptidase FtsI family protein n=1 Tax=Oerskovia flava TaxID=2986422 RepID=UPI0022408F7B|nr:penicillin-binding protein 2 [Oerskovia sp. JB1-3-2]